MERNQSYTEIHTSYIGMEKTMEKVLSHSDEIKNILCKGNELVFVGCGSSYWMSMSAAHTIQARAKLKARAVKAGDIVMCPEDYAALYDEPVFILPSRSGLSQDLLTALEILRSYYPDAKIFSIVAYENSKLADCSDFTIEIPWVNEISVCQTRTFNSLYTAFIAIAVILAENSELLDDLRTYLANAPELYKRGEEKVKHILAEQKQINTVVALGSGRQYGMVIEGAYIIIEMAEMPCNYYQLLEYRHGPIVTETENTLVVICGAGEHALAYEKQMAEEIKKAKVIWIGAPPQEGWCDYSFAAGRAYTPEVIGLYYSFVMQSLAYHLSVARGCDPDSPGELVRFIIY